MTILQKAIMSEIKAHVKEDVENKGIELFAKYLKGMKFESMAIDSKREQNVKVYKTDITFNHYTVKTRFKAAKYDNNIAVWDVVIYSNGECGVYYDGEEYTTK